MLLGLQGDVDSIGILVTPSNAFEQNEYLKILIQGDFELIDILVTLSDDFEQSECLKILIHCHGL